MYGYNTFGKQVINQSVICEKDILMKYLERGICLGTVVLWVLFVWLEASVRLREIKTIDLCRPFAAHWYYLILNFLFNSLFCFVVSGIPWLH
jgi:hypothetical protein